MSSSSIRDGRPVSVRCMTFGSGVRRAGWRGPRERAQYVDAYRRAIAVSSWLVRRQGVETVKPDVHLHRFSEAAVGRPLRDEDDHVVTETARQLRPSALFLELNDPMSPW